LFAGCGQFSLRLNVESRIPPPATVAWTARGRALRIQNACPEHPLTVQGPRASVSWCVQSLNLLIESVGVQGMTTAPKAQARIAGGLYLVIMVAALFSEIAARGALIVDTDASVTARNILANEGLFRLGGVLDILTYCCDVAVAALLYQLTKPAGPHLATVAAFFRLAYAAMAGALCFFWFGALGTLQGHGLDAFTLSQQQAMAFSQLELRSTGFVVALIFFGFHLILLGALLIKSRYLPAWIGALLVLAGSCYIMNSLAILTVPSLSLGIWLLLPGFFSEKLLTLWLLFIGLNEKRWREHGTA